MNEEKYDRMVALNCPTCGNTLFENDDSIQASVTIVKCLSCEIEFTTDELIHLNGGNVEQHVSEIGKTAVKDIIEELKKTIRDALKNNKNITFK